MSEETAFVRASEAEQREVIAALDVIFDRFRTREVDASVAVQEAYRWMSQHGFHGRLSFGPENSPDSHRIFVADLQRVPAPL